mgnify:FL=1
MLPVNPCLGFTLKCGAAAVVLAYGLLTMDASAQAWAQEAPEGKTDAVALGLTYKADVSGVVAGGVSKAGRFLDDLELTAEFSLEDLVGWSGAKVYGHLLSNTGGVPNDLAGTLQGIDNIEVGRPRAKLYQLWLEQEFADLLREAEVL